MNALADLQQRFQRWVERRDGGVESRIADERPPGPRVRLEVYAEACRLRLVEVLRDDFPALRAMTGDAEFTRLARAYVESHPSRHFNLRWYGDGLAGFLRGGEWAAQPALAEMAALEWDMTLVFDAADEAVATAASLAAVPPEAWGELRPAPIAALRRCTLHWNVGAIRTASDRGTRVPPARPLDPPEPWAVWRRDLTVHYRPLEADEGGVLDLLRGGASLGQVCEHLARDRDPAEVAPRAAALLGRWVADGWIRALPVHAG